MNDSDTIQFVRTLRLDEQKLFALMDKLDARESPKQQERRSETRYPYRDESCPIYIQQPGHNAPRPFLVATRDLSSRGMSFLHGSYVHRGSRCVVQLRRSSGEVEHVSGNVVAANYVDINVHFVHMKFKGRVKVYNYCIQALKVQTLFVEDEAPMIRLGQALLGRLNTVVDVATNGADAMRLAQQNWYDLILMDIDMPGMNGIEATTRLRKQGYTGTIVALTSLTRAEDRERCLAAGCDHVINKPYDIRQIRLVVDSCRHQPITSSLLGDMAMAEPIKCFVASLYQLTKSLEKCMARGDRKKLEILARKTRSIAATCGFAALSQIATKIEEAISNREPNHELWRLVTTFCQLCRRVVLGA
ncbi:MAG: response regulator [Planctomycetota bacterium]